MKKKSNIIIIFILSVAIILLGVILFLIYNESNKKVTPSKPNISSDFSVNFIRMSNKNIGQENYMISPYSVEVALSMVREGANSTTLDELEKVVPVRNINDLSIKNKVNIANGLFVKNSYKSSIKSDYVNGLKNDYNSDVLYDEFESPDKINKWVSKETNGMIKKVFDSLDDRFVLAVVNAIGMEEEWYSKFDCSGTVKDSFNLIDGKTMEVSMMNKSFNNSVSYYEDNSMKSIIMPYKMYSDNGVEVYDDGEQLEFIGILPNSDIDEYINNMSLDTIKAIDKNKKISSSDYSVNVSIPKFKFDYNFKKFKNTLIDMGINEVFSPVADFSNMFENVGDYYINEAVHKSFVQVDEDGTKAAAVTGFTFKDNAMIMSDESIDIVFDKPFVFLIKDVNSDEILFFGVVYEPSEYTENKCE